MKKKQMKKDKKVEFVVIQDESTQLPFNSINSNIDRAIESNNAPNAIEST